VINIVCPSGFAFTMRVMTVTELAHLGQAIEFNEADGGLTRTLNACWEDLVDPGPYRLNPGTKPDWNKVLDGDVIVATMKLRIASLGPTLAFNFECERCGRKQPDELDVDLTGFDEKMLPEATRHAVETGVPLVAQQLNGQAVHFHPMLIGQLARLTQIKRQHVKRMKSASTKDIQREMKAQPWDFLVRQVTRVEALGDKAEDVMARMDWARHMPLDDFFHLRDQLAEADCGLDLSIEATCQHVNCGWEQEELTLPLRGAFFRPPTKNRKKATETNDQPSET